MGVAIDLNEKIENGKQIYNTLLNKVHKNNIEEMYNYFEKKFERIELYGDTPEKRLINYCTYKTNCVISAYRGK